MYSPNSPQPLTSKMTSYPPDVTTINQSEIILSITIGASQFYFRNQKPGKICSPEPNRILALLRVLLCLIVIASIFPNPPTFMEETAKCRVQHTSMQTLK